MTSTQCTQVSKGEPHHCLNLRLPRLIYVYLYMSALSWPGRQPSSVAWPPTLHKTEGWGWPTLGAMVDLCGYGGVCVQGADAVLGGTPLLAVGVGPGRRPGRCGDPLPSGQQWSRPSIKRGRCQGLPCPPSPSASRHHSRVSPACQTGVDGGLPKKLTSVWGRLRGHRHP